MDNIKTTRHTTLSPQLEEKMAKFYMEIQVAEYPYNNDRDCSAENVFKQLDILKKSLTEDDGFELHLAYFGETPVGFMELHDEFNVEASYSYVYVHALLVTETHRGKGIGRSLLKLAKKIAKDKGYKHVGLSVLPKNTPALKLYQSEGFADYAIEMMAEMP